MVDKKLLQSLPNFTEEYQTWYSSALACISQLMPDRVSDFVAYYKPERTRKEITWANYTVSDYLKGLKTTRGVYKETVVGPDAAIPAFQQQLQILKALEKRLDSSLFDIRAMVQADMFDSELDSADALDKKGFHHGAGAVAGVVLEGHLGAVCANHKLTVRGQRSISKLNDALKAGKIIEVPGWRQIQRLSDLRNLCTHKNKAAPTEDDVAELIDRTRKITMTVF